MSEQNPRAARPARPRRFDELKLSNTQGFAANIVAQSYPAKKRAHEQQYLQARLKERQEENQNEKLRHGREDFESSLRKQVHLASDESGRRPDDEREKSTESPTAKGVSETESKSVEKPREDIAASIIRTQPVMQAWPCRKDLRFFIRFRRAPPIHGPKGPIDLDSFVVHDKLIFDAELSRIGLSQ